MQLIATIITGALAGWIASMIMKTNDKQGFISDVIVGVVGSFIGNWTFSTLSISIGSGWISNLITAVIGACILLFLVKLIKKS